MTPRYQKVILWLLLVSSVLMAAYLIRMRARAQDQLAAVADATPMPAPVEAKPGTVTFILGNDADGSLTSTTRQIALPAESTTRAKALLNALFAEYAEPGSSHPLAAVPAVNDVFLLPVQAAPGNTADPGQMAVINLSDAFTDRHPSGILVETLTVLSILGTLHANLPQITQVRFLIDGQPRDTLAGHVDLTRTYLSAGDVPQPADTAAAPTPSTEPAP